MATNPNENQTKGAAAALQLATIEELKGKHATPESVYNGVITSQNWKPGKQVTEDEYKQAVSKFLTSPISGKKVIKNA